MRIHAGWWLMFLVIFSGCSVANQSAMTPPGIDLSGIEKIHVIWLAGDNRKINVVIKDQLLKMGFTATTDPDNPSPSKVDAKLTYADRWMYGGFRVFMTQLTIYITNPNRDFILGAGKSYQTAFVGKSSENMAKEALESIFPSRKTGHEESPNIQGDKE